jgi:hypothetical protein
VRVLGVVFGDNPDPPKTAFRSGQTQNASLFDGWENLSGLHWTFRDLEKRWPSK